MNRGALLSGLLAMVLAGCASYGLPRNSALQAQGLAPAERYGLERRTPSPGDARVAVTLAFSGGGTRAAALAYGVLRELHDTRIASMAGAQTPLLQEVEAISAVSGGSFVAAYYGLHGEAMFSSFEQAFLRRDFRSPLIRNAFSPRHWFSRRTRSSVAAFGYERHIFHEARYADLLARPGPLVIINASDLEGGNRFSFLQEYFDALCSDLRDYPLAQAVAASSAVPVLFEPVVLENRGGCDSGQAKLAALRAGVGQRREALQDAQHLDQELSALEAYADKQNRRYIHLADGGLTDNLGLRGLLEVVDATGGPRAFTRSQGRDPPRELVVISVDASADAASGLGLSARAPSLVQTINATSDIQLHRYNTATLDLTRERLRDWAQALSAPGHPVTTRLVSVSFRDIGDPAQRRYLESIPTDFVLQDAQVDALIQAGRNLLRDNPEFKALLRALATPAP